MFRRYVTVLHKRLPSPNFCRFYNNPYLNRLIRVKPIVYQNKKMSIPPASDKATATDSASILAPGSLKQPIVWIDCEMTGLDHINDKIIEICCIITDGDLNIVDEEGYESVIHYDQNVMDNMGEWCITQHGKSGLTEKVLSSVKTREQVENELLEYVSKWIPEKRKGVLAGNSVHMDRLFMLKEFPKVIDHLFYRIIDVSSIMEVARRHNPQLAKVAYRKNEAHTAKADILESIEQLRFYETHYLKNEAETREFVDKRKEEIRKEMLEQQQLHPVPTDSEQPVSNKRDQLPDPELETSSPPEKKAKSE